MKIYISYEEGSKGRYTLDKMKSLYRHEVNLAEYPTFDIWLADMLKSGVFVEKDEPYSYYKTAKKTAEENNMFMINGNVHSNHSMLFDFSFIDGLDIPSREKELIKQESIKNCSICNRTAFVIEFPDNFTHLSCYVDFLHQKVFNAKTYKLQYVVLKAVHIKYSHAERNSTYDQFYNLNRSEFELSCKDTLAEEVEI